MKRNFILGLVGLAALPFIISSCGDDEPAPAGVNFELADQVATESDGSLVSFHPDLVTDGQGRNIQVKLTFDKALASQAVIKYKVEGTASSVNPVPTSGSDFDVNDYELAEGDNLTLSTSEFTIAKGATEAIINVTLFEDYDFEYNKNALTADKISYETIIITLVSVTSGPVKLGTQLTHTVNVTEDDAVFLLQWTTNNTTSAGDVDLDLLFSLDNELVWGVYTDQTYEITNFPAGYPDGQYGLSYTYYSGTSDDVDFLVGVFGTSGTINGQRYNYPDATPLIFRSSYTLKNINKWDPSTSPPKIVQTMTKSGINFNNFSTITVPAEGSRIDQTGLRLNPDVLENIHSIENLKKFATRNNSLLKFNSK